MSDLPPLPPTPEQPSGQGGAGEPAPPPPPPPPPPAPPPPAGGGYGAPPPPPPPPGGQGGYVPPAPQGYIAPGAGYAAQRTDGLAIASLVIGIVSIVCSFVCLGVILGPTAAIMGFISRQRIATSGGALGGGALATIGLILGIIGFLASVGAFFTIVVTGILSNSPA